MKEIALALLTLVEEAGPVLRAVGAPHGAHAGWTPKQILGHLIDSASNNHQRFVRAALHGETALPGYEQERWVALHGYAEAEWDELIELWTLYNRHLARLLERIPPEAAGAPCRIGGTDPIRLDDLARDYLRHARQHLLQITATRA